MFKRKQLLKCIFCSIFISWINRYLSSNIPQLCVKITPPLYLSLPFQSTISLLVQSSPNPTPFCFYPTHLCAVIYLNPITKNKEKCCTRSLATFNVFPMYTWRAAGLLSPWSISNDDFLKEFSPLFLRLYSLDIRC